MDKMRAITVFRRIVELGSFKAAADELGLSKAAVSKNLNELENYLMQPLIIRTTRKMRLTPFGEDYFNGIVRILDELQSMESSIIESSNYPKGRLNLSIPMSMGLAAVNQAICEFLKAHSQLSVSLQLEDNYADLVSREFDIAIRGGAKLTDSTLKSRILARGNQIVCASPDYLHQHGKVSKPEDLMQHNCLSYTLSQSHSVWCFKKNSKEARIKVSSSLYEANNSLAVVQAAKYGLGIAKVPKALAREELLNGELIELLPQWKQEELFLYALVPFHKVATRKVRVCLDYMAEYFENYLE